MMFFLPRDDSDNDNDKLSQMSSFEIYDAQRRCDEEQVDTDVQTRLDQSAMRDELWRRSLRGET